MVKKKFIGYIYYIAQNMHYMVKCRRIYAHFTKKMRDAREQGKKAHIVLSSA